MFSDLQQCLVSCFKVRISKLQMIYFLRKVKEGMFDG
jgi:hypothetical protein